MTKLTTTSMLLFALLTLTVTSCSTTSKTTATTTPKPKKKGYLGYTYEYTYALITNDTIQKEMKFEDEIAALSFNVMDKGITFTLKNKTDQALKILWDEASLVQFGKAGKVMHVGTKYIDRNNSQPPTVIPPKSRIEDQATPTDNVEYDKGYYGTYYSRPGGWETKDLLPTHDLNKEEIKNAIQAFVGSELRLFMPVEASDGKKQNHNFVFKVQSVKCKDCEEEAIPKKG